MEVLERDPALGEVIGIFPSDRARLLLTGIIVCGLVAVLLDRTVGQVEDWWGPVITVFGMAVIVLTMSWHNLGLWNREVILYEHGFSYREGSRTVYFFYSEVRSIRQWAKRQAFFGGRIRRSRFRFTITTASSEQITLDNLYRHIAKLGTQLELSVNAVLAPANETRLASGESISFADNLALDRDGLHRDDDRLLWSEYSGYQLRQGQLHLLRRDGSTWYALPLDSVDNITLILPVLHRYKTAS